MKKLARIAFFVSLVLVVSAPAFAVTLTSLTLEMSTALGEFTNLPGGMWITHTGDVSARLGVRQNGIFLNIPDGENLGAISADLNPGLNTFELFGTSLTGGSDYYGLSLFFDLNATPPDIGVYNLNNSTGTFTVTEAGKLIGGNANGGFCPDVAPGSSIYKAPNGDKVELIAFNVFYNLSNQDIVSWGTIGTDGLPDTYATLQLEYTVPAPATLLLFGSGFLALVGLRKRFTRR